MERISNFAYSRSGRRGLLLVGLLAAGCTEATGPLRGVVLRTEVTPATAAAGDTVVLRAILMNSTPRRLDLSASCGPPVFFEIRASTGAAIYPVPLTASFTCERVDQHDLDPRETDTVSTVWRVSAARGSYLVRSGFPRGAGLERLTTPITLTIR